MIPQPAIVKIVVPIPPVDGREASFVFLIIEGAPSFTTLYVTSLPSTVSVFSAITASDLTSPSTLIVVVLIVLKD